jgi:hypothetical protein
VVCGLLLHLPVLALTLAPSAERVRHMTMNLLPGDGLLAGTGKAQLFRCEHLCVVYDSRGDFARSQGAKASEGLIFQG